jgi:hypothetical protein
LNTDHGIFEKLGMPSVWELGDQNDLSVPRLPTGADESLGAKLPYNTVSVALVLLDQHGSLP